MAKGSSRRHARAESARLVASAESFLRAGNAKEALGLLQRSAQLVPDDALIQARLGQAYLAVGAMPHAVEALRRALASQPDAGEVHGALGDALRALRQEDAAIGEYREAVRLSPELADAHGKLADLLFKRGLRTEAASEYEQASALAPGTPRARLQKGIAHLAMDRLAEAEDELRQLVAIDPSSLQGLEVLGRILLLVGKFEEARAVCERTLEQNPLNGSAYFGLVQARRITEADRPWVERMQALLGSTTWHAKLPRFEVESLEMTLHFALGKVMDDLGRYAEAMTHFDAANRIRHQRSPFNAEAVERRVDRLIARYTPELFAQHRSIGADDRTPILICGLPRSGTSLVERIVSSHPAVHGRGEVDYWNERGPRWFDVEPAALARVADTLRADYLRVLRQGVPAARAGNVTRVTDKMPFNFYWLGLVHLLFPSATLVVCRRKPVDVALSIYMTQFSVAWDFASALGDLATYHRLYQRLMEHWRAVLPPERLLEVDYEDVVADTERVSRSLLAFSGLEWDPAALHPERNPQPVATASLWQARQPIYRSSVERWRHYEPWIGELRGLLD